VVRERLHAVHGLALDDIDVEMIGTGAAFRGLSAVSEPAEVRLRMAARTASQDQAAAVGWEVESLYTNGPAGGGGARSSVTSQVSIRSCPLPRELVTPQVDIQEVQ
jgi:hypothetical protein